MRTQRASIAFVAGLALCALPASASTIDLSWNGCAPIETNYMPGAEPVAFGLYASVVGQSQAHKGYEVWLLAGDANDTLPDAWRFDDGGCQGPTRIQIDHLAPAVVVKACPSFQGFNPSVPIKTYQLASPFLGVPTTLAQMVVANAYPAGVLNPDPNQRYFLGRFWFDHFESSVEGEGTPGVTCGGFERNMCFSLFTSRCNWLTMDNVEVPFEIGQGFLTFRGECKPVPAANSTWGSIKGQYRR